MTRITNNDQILALVRSQLQRMAKRDKSARSSRTGAAAATQTLSGRQKVETLASIEDLSERELAEGFVRIVLAEEFGETIAATPGFQRVVERTAKLLEASGELRGRI